MLKNHHSNGLLLGIFVLAYAGFLYAGYVDRHTPSSEQQKNESLAAAGLPHEAPGTATGYGRSRIADDFRSHGEHTASERRSERAAHNNKTDKRKSHKSKPDDTRDLTARQIADRQNAMLEFDRYQQSRSTQPVPAPASAKASRGLTVAAGLTSPVLSGRPSAPLSASRSTGSTPASEVTASTPSPLPATPDGFSSPGDPSRNSDNGDVTQPAVEDTEPEPPLMATPDCPFSLPDSTGNVEIEQMLSTYGCRYRKSCTKKNDGTSGYQCQWEFIRPV